jgi:hypothetical protein
LTDERQIQHIAGPVEGIALCGALLKPDKPGLALTCEVCWEAQRHDEGKRR